MEGRSARAVRGPRRPHVGTGRSPVTRGGVRLPATELRRVPVVRSTTRSLRERPSFAARRASGLALVGHAFTSGRPDSVGGAERRSAGDRTLPVTGRHFAPPATGRSPATVPPTAAVWRVPDVPGTECIIRASRIQYYLVSIATNDSKNTIGTIDTIDSKTTVLFVASRRTPPQSLCLNARSASRPVSVSVTCLRRPTCSTSM